MATGAADGPANNERVDLTSSVDLPSSVDVAIVGAGFTGLWSAYYLLESDPSLTVLVLEAQDVGFGASGRNGGWVSALWPVSPATVAARSGRDGALSMGSALRETVRRIGDTVLEEGIDAGFVQGGTLALARGPGQARRARAAVRDGQQWADGTIWLDRSQAIDRLAASDAGGRIDGATFNPHCARVHPGRLVRGLARVVQARGAQIATKTPVARIDPRRVTLRDGRTVTARAILRATEAWTSTFSPTHRAIAPVYSLIVATEPLSRSTWESIGLEGRETFSDHGHVICYGQRSTDDRLVFGGRGAPYHWGSRIEPAFDVNAGVFERLRRSVTTLLPQLASTTFTHAWGGPLGIARDWHPSVTFDSATGLGAAGGYVGDGVAASNLAGLTLAELVLGRETPHTRLPWVGHRCPAWEPEPARWLGINAGLMLARAADAQERVSGRPSPLARVLNRLTGH